MFSYFFIVALLPALILAQTPFRECGNGRPTPTNVDIAGCTEEPCQLVRGTDSINRFSFTTPIATNTVRPSVRAFILGIGIEYPLPERVLDGCLTLEGSSCPLDANEDVVYRLAMPIEDNYPEVSIDIEFSVLGDNGVVLSCSRTRGSVVSA